MMRNRFKQRKSTEGVISENPDHTNGPGDASEEMHEGDLHKSETDDDDANAPTKPLTRTTTKEEITQTDDEVVNVQPPGKRSWSQYRRLVFVLGCIMGMMLAWAFRSPDLQLEGLLDSVDMADFFDDLRAAFPSALPTGLVKEAKEIQQHSREAAGSGAFSIGEQMFTEGMSAHYPVVMVQCLPPSLYIHDELLRFRVLYPRDWKVGQLPIARTSPSPWQTHLTKLIQVALFSKTSMGMGRIVDQAKM
jgi:hypothetical protein